MCRSLQAILCAASLAEARGGDLSRWEVPDFNRLLRMLGVSSLNMLGRADLLPQLMRRIAVLWRDSRAVSLAGKIGGLSRAFLGRMGGFARLTKRWAKPERPVVGSTWGREGRVQPVVGSTSGRDGRVQPVVGSTLGREGRVQPVVGSTLGRDGRVQPVVGSTLGRDVRVQPVVGSTSGRDGRVQPVVGSTSGRDGRVQPVVGSTSGQDGRVQPVVGSTSGRNRLDQLVADANFFKGARRARRA